MKILFFEKIKRTGKPLARVTKNKREMTQINKIRRERIIHHSNTNDYKRVF